jgi:hypothetical protein
MRIARRLLPLLGVVLWFGAAQVQAQEDETSAQKQYREDYEEYQKIAVIKDPFKRADQLLEFVQARPKSQILANAQTDYLSIVQDLAKQSRWDAVVTQAERFVKIRPRVCETYYFLGSALKEQKKIPEAMDALAKCFVLKCLVSEKARQYLEYIYKGVNKGSTAGMETIIQKARSEIGG